MTPAPQLLDSEIHLYCLSISHDVAELTSFKRLLSITELERAGLLKSDQIRNRYIAGRGMLREILCRYLDRGPADVLIATGEHGKPFIADGTMDLRFNLSHVDDLLVLAVASGVEVGVDIEKIAADKPVHDMARLAFSRREHEELLAMPTSRQIQAFYHIWVRKEASMKACGRGFSLSSSSFDVPMSMQALVNCNQSLLHVQNIDVPENYCAAVAVEAGSAFQSPPAIVWVVPKT
jgi:4'-phosphopantetheinyl transferase